MSPTHAQDDVESPKEAPRARAPIPPSSRAVKPSFVLRPVRVLALLAVLGVLFARAFVPASRGVVVGMSDWVDRADVFAGALTQFLGFALAAVAGAQIIQLLRSEAPGGLKVVTTALGVLALVTATGTAAMERAPSSVLSVLAATTALVALLAGLDALRQHTGGMVGWVWILTGLSASLRLAAVHLAERALTIPDAEIVARAAVVAQWVATGAFGLLLIAHLVAMAFLARHARAFVSPIAVGVLGLTFFVTYALATPQPEPDVWRVLLDGGVRELMLRPYPKVPSALLVAQSAAAVFLAGGVLLVRRQVSALVGALSLALLTAGTADVPLLGLALLVSSTSLLLSVRDVRGIWAAIGAGAPRDGRQA